MSSPPNVRCACLLAGVVGLVCARPGRAQPSPAVSTASHAAGAAPSPQDADATRARARYDAGTQAFSEGRSVEAALDFEAAAAIKPNAVALYTGALAWERANAPERAADDYAAALAMPGLDSASATAGALRLAELRAALGTALVTAPAGSYVQLDTGSEWPPPAALHAAPGVHTLTLRAAGRPLTRTTVVLRLGETTKVDLSAAAAAPAAATSSTATQVKPHAHDGLRTAGLVTLGAAGALLLGGVLLGAEALKAKRVYDATPSGAAYDHASSLQTWTNVAFASGGAFVGVGLLLVLWPSPRDPVGVAGVGAAAGPAFWMGGGR